MKWISPVLSLCHPVIPQSLPIQALPCEIKMYAVGVQGSNAYHTIYPWQRVCSGRLGEQHSNVSTCCSDCHIFKKGPFGAQASIQGDVEDVSSHPDIRYAGP